MRKLHSFKFTPKTIHCRNYKNYNKEILVNELNNIDWRQLYEIKDVNVALSFFINAVSNVFDRHAPPMVKKVRGRRCPWLNRDIKTLIQERDRQLKRARRTKSENDWSSYKQLRNRCNNMIKYAKTTHYKNLIHENTFKPEYFWKCIKEIYPLKSKVSVTPQPNANEKLNNFKIYFSSVITKLKVSAFPLFNFIWKAPNQFFPRTYNKFRFSYVSTVFVERQLKTLKNNKTAGLDNLPSRLLKDSASVISRPIAYIINSSLETATVPTLWKNSKIVPIHKSGPTDKEENFRPISILPILSKVMERAVQQQFLEYLETNKLLSKFQFG